MAQGGWGSKPTGNDWHTTTAGLAWKILTDRNAGGLNYYEGAERLASGGNDDDFWRHATRGSKSAGMDWHHDGRGYPIIIAARIPYIIRTKRAGKQYKVLDHLLVGYTDIWDHDEEADIDDWDPGAAGAPEMKKLGDFLTDDLWPGSAAIQRVVTWHNRDNGTNYGYTPGSYTLNPWNFREISTTVEASARITIFEEGGAYRYLLIGYEGGGGW